MNNLKKIPLDNNFVYVAILQVTAVGASILLNIYSASLFLGSFSSSWLPYYFIISALFLGFGVSSLLPLLEKPKKYLYVSLQLLFAILIMIFLFAHNWPSKVLELTYTFIFLLIGAVHVAISWNISGFAFEIRTFRKYTNFFLMFTSIGAMSISLISYLGIDFFGRNTVLYLALACIFINCGALLKIKLLQQQVKAIKGKPLLRKYPLFIILAAFLSLICIVTIFTKFQMFYFLNTNLSATQIAKYMTVFYLLSNVMSFIMQAISRPVLDKVGVSGLLMYSVILILVVSVPVFFFKNMYTVAIPYAVVSVMYNSFIALGKQVSLNALPSAIKNKGQIIIKVVTNNIGEILAAGLIILFAYKYQFYPYEIMSVVCLIALFFLIAKIKHYYGASLLTCIKEKRFYMPIMEDELDFKFLQKEINSLLSSSDSDKIKLGLSLLRLIKPSRAPLEIFELFKHEDPFIRMKAYNALVYYKKLFRDDLLRQQLEKEYDREAAWALLRLILEKYPEMILKRQKEFLISERPEYRAAAVIALSKHGELSDVSQAITQLEKMVDSKDEKVRLYAAKVLGMIFFGAPITTLKKLISDKNHQISRHAIRAAGSVNNKQIVDLIIDQLGKPNVTYEAARVLLNNKVDVAPMLFRKCLRMDIHNFKPLIRVFCQLDSEKAERYLIKLIPRLQLIHSVEFAKQIALRANRVSLSHDLQTTIYRNIDSVIQDYKGYLHLIEHEQSEGKKFEFFLRKQLVEKKLICYLAALIKPKVILNLLPKLALQQKNSENIYTHALALEYLDWLIEDRDLAKKVFTVIENKITSKKLQRHQIDDKWVLHVQNYQTIRGKAMDTIDKIFALRKTEIFSRIPAEFLVSVAEECEVVEFSAGEKVYGLGERPDSLHILLSGKVEITSSGVVIRTLKESDFYGLFTTFGDEVSTVDVMVTENSTQLALSKQILEQLVDDYPDILREITRFMSKLFLKFMNSIPDSLQNTPRS